MDYYIGKMLDNRYEILERIGTGGMAVVYKAKCHRLNRLVAIKILKHDLAQDANVRRRFNTEAQAVALLSHSNIVSVYDVSKGGDMEYLVMELIDGITLKQYMEKRGALNWRESLHFITQIMRGIGHAHSRGIVHRDIKPQNIMVLRDGSVKVTDFGIACMEDTAQTLTQQAFGSVHYISPEQAKGDRPDTRSDIYSAGVMFYELLCGRLPFEGDSAVSVALQHLSSIPLSPRELNPEVPVQLELICLKAMASDLEKRYTSAEAMIEDLETFRKNPNVTLEFELEDLQAHTEDEPTRKIPQNLESAKVSVRQSEPMPREDDEEEERGGGGAIWRILILLLLLGAVITGLVYLFKSIFASFITPVPEYTVPDLRGYTLSEAQELPEIVDVFQVVPQKESFSDEFEAGEIMAQDPHADTVKKSDLVIYVTISSGVEVEEMPDVKGLESRVAAMTLKELVEKLNLTIETVQVPSDSVTMGYVVETLPAAESPLGEGSMVTFYVSEGPEIPTTTVPLFEGRNLEEVKAELGTVWKLKLGKVTPEESDRPSGEILKQSILTSTEVDEQTPIDFVVSEGKVVQEQTITINCVLPQDREQVQLMVTLNGIPQYDRTVETSEEFVRVSLTGTGTGYVTIYWDGVVYQEFNQQFD